MKNVKKRKSIHITEKKRKRIHITEGEDEPNFFEGSEYSPLIPRYICDNEKCKEEEEDSSRDLEKEWEEYQNPIID